MTQFLIEVDTGDSGELTPEETIETLKYLVDSAHWQITSAKAIINEPEEEDISHDEIVNRVKYLRERFACGIFNAKYLEKYERKTGCGLDSEELRTVHYRPKHRLITQR